MRFSIRAAQFAVYFASNEIKSALYTIRARVCVCVGCCNCRENVTGKERRGGEGQGQAVCVGSYRNKCHTQQAVQYILVYFTLARLWAPSLSLQLPALHLHALTHTHTNTRSLAQTCSALQVSFTPRGHRNCRRCRLESRRVAFAFIKKLA